MEKNGVQKLLGGIAGLKSTEKEQKEWQHTVRFISPKSQLLLVSKKNSLLALETLLKPDVVSFLDSSFVIDIFKAMCSSIYLDASLFSDETFNGIVYVDPFSRLIEHLLREDTLEMLGAEGVVSILQSMPYEHSRFSSNLDGNGAIFKQALQPVIVKKLGRDLCHQLFNLKQHSGKTIWPLTFTSIDTRVEIFDLLLSNETVSVIGAEMATYLLACSSESSDIFVGMDSSKELDRTRASSELKADVLGDSFFWRICKERPLKFNSILEFDVIDSLGVDPVVQWLNMKLNEYLRHSYAFLREEACNNWVQDSTETIQAIFKLIDPKKIEALGSSNLQKLLRVARSYLIRVRHDQDTTMHFQSHFVSQLIKLVMDPDAIDALGADFVSDFVIKDLLLHKVGDNMSYFDLEYRTMFLTPGTTYLGTEDRLKLDDIFNENTLQRLGVSRIMPIFLANPVFLSKQIFNQYFSSEQMDEIRKQILASLASVTGRNRHHQLDLSEHWRFRDVAEKGHNFICVTFDINDRTYRLPVNINLLGSANNIHSRKNIFNHVSELVRLLGGKNKEIWT